MATVGRNMLLMDFIGTVDEPEVVHLQFLRTDGVKVCLFVRGGDWHSVTEEKDQINDDPEMLSKYDFPADDEGVDRYLEAFGKFYELCQK